MEAALLDTAREGDETAFARLIEPYRSQLHAHCYRMLGSVHDAEDAMQEVSLRAWRALGRFEGRSSLRSWLYTIATHQAIDALRKNQRHRLMSLDRQAAGTGEDESGTLADVLMADQDNPQNHAQTAERNEWVRQAVAKLPEHLRSVVVMVYNRGLKYREAADQLGLPVGTIKSRLHAALLKLQEAWSRSSLALEN